MSKPPIAIPIFDGRQPLQAIIGSTWQITRDAMVRLNDLINRTGGPTGKALGPLPVWTVADGLPSAADFAWCLIGVSDESGGATVAFSDGSDWRRFQDRAVVS